MPGDDGPPGAPLLGIAPPEAAEVTDPEGLGGFDPEDQLGAPEEVAPDTVRGLLSVLGTILARFLAVDLGEGEAALYTADELYRIQEHWRFTPDELDQLTPPVTRIINRRPRLQRAMARGDELTVAVALAGHFGVQIDTSRLVANRRAEHGIIREDPARGRGAAPDGAAPGAGFAAT